MKRLHKDEDRITELFVDLCKNLIRKDDDYLSKSKVRKNNSSMTKIYKLVDEMKALECLGILENLLYHEDCHVRLAAAAQCVENEIFIDCALNVLLKINKDEHIEPIVRLDAGMILRNYASAQNKQTTEKIANRSYTHDDGEEKENENRKRRDDYLSYLIDLANKDKIYQDNKVSIELNDSVELQNDEIQCYARFVDFCLTKTEDKRLKNKEGSYVSVAMKIDAMIEELNRCECINVLSKLLNHKSEIVRVEAMRCSLEKHLLVEPVLERAVNIVYTRDGTVKDSVRIELGKLITNYALDVEREINK